ncbi:coagulation factor V isoform X1 [Coregonus clupeaformis]|uniref:coagulation factor V isoform X1 n=1 Tax=Coregonus clupeaformis TaxID=59861 RepID=UPI001E1C2D46|nr:coagulation factor V isoform X1 [Coregonus clupeaformis]
MRLHSWEGTHRLLPLLVLFSVLLSHTTAEQHSDRKRYYYIAAVNIDWDYTSNGPHRSGPSYKKVVYREYEEGFKQAKTHPSWLGLLGPTIRGQEGETIVVMFKNMADSPYSLHAHGIAYGKQSEGSLYFDNTSQFEKEDDAVPPGGEHTYYWEVTSDVVPRAADPSCLTYTYLSHFDIVQDYNSGLIGTLLICKAGSLDVSGEQVLFHQEYVFLMGVLDESRSRYKPKMDSATATQSHIKHTINGYTNGSVPGLTVCAHTSVSLHLVGMSSEPELFSVHINGQVLQQAGHRVSSVGLIAGTATSANMTAVNTGRWLLSSHTSKHLEAGMHGFVEVRSCEGFNPPKRKLTLKQKRESQEWTYYIAAEEVVWDYAPNMPEYIDGDFKFKYLKQSPERIGQKYKKAVYTQYKNARFTERAENKQRKMEEGIIGPVIRAQIHDVIKIVFKNMATRPYSIYPHGLTIDKAAEGANYPAGGNQTHGVQPGETHIYVWEVIEENEPLAGDSQCLTRMYHSAVNTPRDIASGLVGPLLICKSQSLDKRNVQLKSDKEQHAMFAVFDENKSWYLDDNIASYSETAKVKKEDPDFYKSNIMHTINGYVFESGQLLGFCNGEIVTWHVSSVGVQDYIQTATFYGHTFDLNDHTEDFLSLFPMTGETITMNMDNIGIWLLASLNSHETTKGMRVKFRDVECYRDYVYEYEDETGMETETETGRDGTKGSAVFSIWKPMDINKAKEEDKKDEVIEKKKKVEIDDYTAGWADLLDLRSIKKKTNETDVEMLDFSMFNYDSVDVPDPDGDANANPTSSSYDAPTNTSLAEREPIDGGNFTNKSIIENATEALNFTTDQLDSSLNSSSMAETEAKNITVLNNSLSITDFNIISGSTNSTAVTATEASPGPFNNSSKAERERVIQIRGDWTTVNSTSKVEALVEELEERITRGDVFSYSVPLSDPSFISTEENRGTDGKDIVLLGREPTTASANENGKASNSSLNITNQSESVMSAEVAELIFILVEEHNMTNFDFETEESGNITVNGSLHTNTTTEQGNGTYLFEATSTTDNSSSGVPQNGKQPSDIETFSDIVPKQNGTANTSGLNHWNSSEETSSESKNNVTVPDVVVELSSESSEFSNETTDANPGAANLSLSTNQQPDSSLEEILSQSSESSKEEVVIYLRNNRSEFIRTISVDLQGEHWGYEGTLEMVPMEMPDHITKYVGNELLDPPNTLEPSPNPETRKPNIKVVHRRQRPRKGYAMKTKKKKEYKPQRPRGRSFSPRGFKPPPITGITPRGTRPISSEEDFSNKAIVIGVPRPDFSDYEIYVLNEGGDDPDAVLDMAAVSAAEEYEYVDYIDPYKEKEDMQDLTLDENAKYFLKMAGDNVRTYFITAEEVQWDYGGYGQRRHDKPEKTDRPTRFSKVVFRGYLDSTFSTPDIRGEMDEHLGILGPVIKAEVGQTIMVFFRNLASRPYSLHANGVSYTKQTEGLSYEDESKHWYKYDNEVQPNTTYTYLWKVNANVGPTGDESDCRTWAYYSGVNPEKDINSGLIGPLLVCRKGTLSRKAVDMREFMLLFMTFDESKSWYYEKNHEIVQRKNKRARVMEPDFRDNLKFSAINGIIFSLKGLRMYTNQTVRWHLFNMGSPRDLHSVHFHGQTFLHKQTRDHTQAVYPLLPGGFATLEMLPSKPGLWQLESEVGLSQQRGMQTLFLVLDNKCYHPLGLISGSVKDNQITANDKRGYWEPHLARLNNQGKYNAWSTDKTGSWIQVDFQRPVVISQVATQGAKQMFSSHYMVNYTISYSTDKKKWIYYKGDSNEFRMTFTGNKEAHQVKVNTFFPPLIGRFIRLHPLHSYNSPMVRMEYYGCELDGCSVPLGMESRRIEDHRITASSTASSWYSGSWQASLARLNTQGTINAWQAKNNNMNQWLQVELAQVKKITGIITQGAKSLSKEMYVISYTLEYSDDGLYWIKYTDFDDNVSKQNFPGNTDNNSHVKNYIYPPIFSRFIRVIPQSWKNSITLRIELLGCDFE